MTSALEQIAWEPCMLRPRPDRAVESYARKRMGLPNPALRYFAPVPWLARAVTDLHAEHGLLIHLDQRIADLVGMVVTQENSCRYCFAAYRAMLWLQGMDRTRIEQLERDLSSGALPPGNQRSESPTRRVPTGCARCGSRASCTRPLVERRWMKSCGLHRPTMLRAPA